MLRLSLNGVLCCAVLCCAVPCRAVPCRAVLWLCSTPRHATPRHATRHYSTRHSIFPRLCVRRTAPALPPHSAPLPSPAPNLQVFALMEEGAPPAAVALVATEGGLLSDMCSGLVRGQFRLRGHMIPETMVCHMGLQGGAQLHGRRVVRIAVHPALQRRGLGSALLKGTVKILQVFV